MMPDLAPIIEGTEEGWRSASIDSRRHDKHRAIKSFVDKRQAVEAKRRADQENDFYEDLVEAAGPVVKAGLGITTLGYSRAYARNFDRAFQGD